MRDAERLSGVKCFLITWKDRPVWSNCPHLSADVAGISLPFQSTAFGGSASAIDAQFLPAVWGYWAGCRIVEKTDRWSQDSLLFKRLVRLGVALAPIYRRRASWPQRAEDVVRLFSGAIFDRHHALEAKGEGEMFYIFNTSMDATELTWVFGHKVFEHDVHGGGSHGGWGSHARMLIYE